MGKPAERNPKTCPYCRTTGFGFEKEHVVPKCLWKKGLPNFMRTVPACKACNSGYSRDEAYFRDMLVMMSDSRHPKVAELAKSTVPSSLLQDPFVRNALRFAKPARRRSPGGIDVGDGVSLPFDQARFRRVIDKIVRGLFFVKSKRPLSPTHEVKMWLGNSFWNEPAFINLQEGMSGWASFGDDVFGCRCSRADTDHDMTTWVFQFYNSVAMFAWTQPVDGLVGDS